jgi:hypothetical protein
VPQPPRIYPHTLRADSAEALAQDFVDAFAAKNYFAVYFMLSPAVKAGLFDPGTMLQLPQLLPGIDVGDLPGTGVYRNSPRPDELALDTMHDPALVFDRLLLAADRQGVLPFDLTDAKIGPVEKTGDGATVALVTRKDPGNIVLHLVEMSAGWWRLDQVSWPGSLDWAKPWGANYAPEAP